MALETYREKRRFGATPEPVGDVPDPASGGRFVVQQHAARRLHYDLRLEIDGTLKCWAVPRGPALDPKEKRLAARTEDHPIKYLTFEEVIPPGNYGAGVMIVWDIGTFTVEGDLSAMEQIEKGELKFVLHGSKLGGGFVLVRTQKKNARDKKAEEWLLIKHRDAAVDESFDPADYPESALTGRTLEEVRAGVPPGQGAAVGPAAVEGAVPLESIPDEATPMLAASLDKPFSDPDWVFELKWDGVRTFARIEHGELRLISRNGRDVTSHYPELDGLPRAVRAASALLDGEIVALDPRGRSDFGLLQSRMHVGAPSPAQIEATPVHFYLFDVLYADGYDLRGAALTDRKAYLERILQPADPLRYAGHIAERGLEFFDLAKSHDAEGIIAKRADSSYVSRRSDDWIKIKIVQEIDVAIGGWTEPRGGRGHFGAILAGVMGDDGLRYVGGAGSGFSEETLENVAAKLRPLAVRRCPFTTTPKTKEKAYWTRPKLVARVRFTGWTRDSNLRHPVFLGLRDDIEPADCIDPRTSPDVNARNNSGKKAVNSNVVHAPRASSIPVIDSLDELEAELFKGKRETVRADIDGKSVRLTHLDRVYFPEPGYTKRDVLAYYFQVADKILPFLRERPLVLHRYPNGIEAEAFYQKDIGDGVPDWADTVTIPSEGSNRDIRYYVANDLAALLHLVNLGAFEFHPWPSRVGSLQQPDYVFFDLDPTPDAAYETVVKVARRFAKLLDETGARAFIKTSGSKGIHLWLPLEPEYEYEQARAFAEIFARVVHSEMPEETTLERMTDKRPKGTIYLDYSQNAYSRPLATVYSVRPRPLATVSAPLAPAELRKTLKAEKFTIKTLPARLESKGDLWAKFWNAPQKIEPALFRLQQRLSR